MPPGFSKLAKRSIVDCILQWNMDQRSRKMLRDWAGTVFLKMKTQTFIYLLKFTRRHIKTGFKTCCWSPQPLFKDRRLFNNDLCLLPGLHTCPASYSRQAFIQGKTAYPIFLSRQKAPWLAFHKANFACRNFVRYQFRSSVSLVITEPFSYANFESTNFAPIDFFHSAFHWISSILKEKIFLKPNLFEFVPTSENRSGLRCRVKECTHFSGWMADRTNIMTITSNVSGGNGNTAFSSDTSSTNGWHRFGSKSGCSWKITFNVTIRNAWRFLGGTPSPTPMNGKNEGGNINFTWRFKKCLIFYENDWNLGGGRLLFSKWQYEPWRCRRRHWKNRSSRRTVPDRCGQKWRLVQTGEKQIEIFREKIIWNDSLSLRIFTKTILTCRWCLVVKHLRISFQRILLLFTLCFKLPLRTRKCNRTHSFSEPEN